MYWATLFSLRLRCGSSRAEMAASASKEQKHQRGADIDIGQACARYSRPTPAHAKAPRRAHFRRLCACSRNHQIGSLTDECVAHPGHSSRSTPRRPEPSRPGSPVRRPASSRPGCGVQRAQAVHRARRPKGQQHQRSSQSQAVGDPPAAHRGPDGTPALSVADVTATPPVSVGPRDGGSHLSDKAPAPPSGTPPIVDSCRGENRA